jgi:hypothetical protein
MAMRSCRVTIQDLDGVSHTVEVTAATLYEAVAQGLAAIRGNEWVAGVAQALTVRVLVSDDIGDGSGALGGMEEEPLGAAGVARRLDSSDRIRYRSLRSRGEPPALSSHFVKSPNFTSCSTRTPLHKFKTRCGLAAWDALKRVPYS